MKNPTPSETGKSWKAIGQKARFLRACIAKATITGTASYGDTNDLDHALFRMWKRAVRKAERTLSKESESYVLQSIETALAAVGVSFD